MTLPEITLPKIDLPFDIPVLLHPSVDHFAIALPVIILLLEFYNLFAKRKSIGVFSFILLVLTIVIFAAAYFTGVVDGKEAYDLLPTEGQAELKEHKLLGTYLLLGTLLLLFFKLLAMTGKKFLKVLFFIALLGFIVLTFKQGQEGGELVYTYGANVERVKNIDDKLFDAQEALEDSQEKKTEKDVSEQTVISTAKKEESTQKEVTSEQKPSSEVDKITEESTQLEEKILEVKEKLKNIDSTVENPVKEVKEIIAEPISTPSLNLEEAKPLEENSFQEETVNTPKPTSLKTQSTVTTASNSVVQVEPQEVVKLNPVPQNKELITIPKVPSVPEPTKVNEKKTLVTKASETIKDAISEKNMKGYKESLEGLASDMKSFFENE